MDMEYIIYTKYYLFFTVNNINTIYTMSSEISPLVEDPSLDFIIPTHNDYSNFTNILFIDQTIDLFQTFVDSVNQDTLPIVYSRFSDVTTLNSFLTSNFSHIQRLCFAFHGFSSDSTDTPSQSLFQDDLFFHDSDLLAGATSFSPNVSFIKNLISQYNVQNIDYLGCNLLNFPNWKSYFELIGSFSSVIVGASDDETGNLKYGGDWILENTNENVKLVYFSSEIDTFTGLLIDYVTESFPGSGINVTYTYTLSGNDATITGFSPTGIANLEIPSTFVVSSSNYTIVSITGNGFYNKGLTGTLTLPNNIRNIVGKFYNNPGLTGTITIPSSVTYLESYCFQYCSGLTGLVILPGLTSIENNCFRYCGFTSVTLPNTITRIGLAAFENIPLTEITIPDSVTWMSSPFGGAGLTTIIMNPNTNGLGITVPSYNVSFYGVTGVDIIAPPPPPQYYTIRNITYTYTLDASNNATITAFTPIDYAGPILNIGTVVDASGTNLSVVAISDSVFASSTMTSIVLDTSITSVAANAFTSASLTTIHLNGTTVINGTSVAPGDTIANFGGLTNIPTDLYSDFLTTGYNEWNQLGADIDGESAGNQSGKSVSLNSDGTIVAIGAENNYGVNGSSSGHVRIYKYDVTKTTSVTDQTSSDFGPIGWRRLGQDIDGEASGDISGTSVSLSSDGYTVSIGAKYNDGTANNAGHVRTYQYDVTKTTNVTDQTSSDFGPVGWRRLGQDIDGEAQDDHSGYSVSLISNDTNGTIVAIGAVSNDGNSNASGHVRVYKYDVNKTTNVTDQTSSDFGPIGWRRLGQDIDGESSSVYSGVSVSLSSDGSIVGIGANEADSKAGHVRVYKYDVTKTTNVTDQNSTDYGPIGWRRLGQDINGEATNDRSGTSVSLSDDGYTVAIGAPYNWENGWTQVGHVRVYRYDVSKTTNVTDQTSSDFGPVGWRRLGQDINGQLDGEASGTILSGISVSLSSNGNTVAIGTKYSNNSFSGQTMVIGVIFLYH